LPLEISAENNLFANARVIDVKIQRKISSWFLREQEANVLAALAAWSATAVQSKTARAMSQKP